MSPKKFFEKVSKSVSFFGLKSCCKGLWGKTPRCTLTTEYTFIRYVPCAEGNLKPSLQVRHDPFLRRAIKLM